MVAKACRCCSACKAELRRAPFPRRAALPRVNPSPTDKEFTMNDAPRSYLTPADRDAEMFEISRLRALALRQEAIDAFWRGVGRLVRRAVAAIIRRRPEPHVEA
jgi:hypothetical protein